MPIYEYNCLKCNLRFEYLVRSSSREIACPHCQSGQLKRLVSAFAFSSKDKQGNVASSSSGCGSCSSHNCSTCSR
ncbi:MAG: zinc ribbon domain-containing protein [Candidatus Omnitrophica bacterium]|nr:zinc ribbon domain-containing protein [Candidatus Omnitrophota bacterium]MDD5552426.1 zinc ribbon domain-containing protein [Candidatus Omnitrophota bacterium]